MKLKKPIKNGFLFLAVITSLVACSSKPDIKEFPKSADAKQEITNLDIAIANSKGKDSDLLAPTSYGSAQASLKEARSMEKDKRSNERVLKEVALGQAYLGRAEKESADNRSKMEDILAARQTAINANANTLLPSAFSKMDNKLKVETANLEKDKDTKLKEKRSDFIAGYNDLELAAIKQHHLGESKALIDEAVKNGASDLAPRSLAETNAKYKEVDLYITQNRSNIPEIEALSAETLAGAQKLSATTSAARGLTAKTPEENAIRMQSEEGRYNQTQSALADQQGANQALMARNSEMSKDQRLNAVYEDARKKFTVEEAEVYKQGPNLVIRLRSLEFPKSQAVLKGQNFALLKKVEDVIESFDKSSVIVEGHTDSTGSAQLNKKLSQQRANAVKEYLEVNNRGNVAEFESKGFGYDKPLSTNKTASGRAQNRRVDVIIEPVKI